MILERQEKKFLEAIRRGLQQDILRVDQLLKQANAPKLLRPADSRRRAMKIVQAVKSKGGRVSREQFAEIATSAGMIATAVGTLYQNGYVKKDPKDKKSVLLGPKALAGLRKA